jgi:hypothetical protein
MTPAVLPGGIIATRNQSNRIELFHRGTNNLLYHVAQTANSTLDWPGWQSLGKTIVGDLAAAWNHSGPLEVFAWGTDGALSHCRQNAIGSAGWSSWQVMDHPGAVPSGSPLFMTHEVGGRLALFARGTDGAIYRTAQTALSSQSWSSWERESNGSGFAGAPTATYNGDFRLEMFAIGSDGALYRKRQNVAGQW